MDTISGGREKDNNMSYEENGFEMNDVTLSGGEGASDLCSVTLVGRQIVGSFDCRSWWVKTILAN